jgi:hypothetical protein
MFLTHLVALLAALAGPRPAPAPATTAAVAPRPAAVHAEATPTATTATATVTARADDAAPAAAPSLPVPEAYAGQDGRWDGMYWHPTPHGPCDEVLVESDHELPGCAAPVP